MIIKRPLITEKSMKIKNDGFYTFETTLMATKHQIAQAVAEMFKVDVLSVRSVKSKVKVHRQRTRRGSFNEAATKKAVVKIKKGQTIALFEASEKDEPQVTITRGEGEPIVVSKEKKSLLKGTKVKVEKMDSKGDK